MEGRSPDAASDAANRYELSAIIGPCTEREAVCLMEELDDVTMQRLGAVWALQRIEADDAEA